MSERAELISTDSTDIERNGTKYRIAVTVKYRTFYHIHCSVLRVRKSVSHDVIDSKSREIKEKDAVQEKAQEMTEWGVERVKEIEDAQKLSIDIDATVIDNDE